MSDGPIINDCGAQTWVKDGKYHRLDGPAYISIDGSYDWWKDGKLHRLDGPAVAYIDGSQYWYVNGKLAHVKNNEEFLRLMKLKALW